ncbi:hypothetical protein [Haloferax sp. YSMS24]|uniref:DUF7553 family protein n=1 Tax=unclassified Haloferax TaxID=2625095 RepID=UPI00398D2708
MTRAELQKASELLRDAAARTDSDVQARLTEQADQLATLAERDEGPDHGRLARHMTVLHEIAEGLDDGVSDTVREARTQVLEYRKTVPGV